MRKTTFFTTAAAALILAGVGGWVASTPQASVTAPAGVQVDPLQMMISAKDLPTQHFHDLTFVFD
jgi:hypothetical protein